MGMFFVGGLRAEGGVVRVAANRRPWRCRVCGSRSTGGPRRRTTRIPCRRWHGRWRSRRRDRRAGGCRGRVLRCGLVAGGGAGAASAGGGPACRGARSVTAVRRGDCGGVRACFLRAPVPAGGQYTCAPRDSGVAAGGGRTGGPGAPRAGAKAKREVVRARHRTLATMRAQTVEQGRFLGGRPPYGYRLVDAGAGSRPTQ